MDTKVGARRFGAVAITLALVLLALSLFTGHLARSRALTQVVVSDAVVRLSAVPGRPAAGYFKIENSGAADRLTAVEVAPPARAEVHESMTMHGATTMAKLAAVPVPASGSVIFAPGGKHLMLFGVPATVKPGGEMAMTLVFARAGKVPVAAAVRSAGDAMDHAHH